MSFEAMAWTIKLKLPTREKFVLLMLANRVSRETGECFPSMALLAEETGMSRRTVIEAIGELERLGVVTVVRKRAGRVNLANTYRLNEAWGGENGAPLVQTAQGGGAASAPEPISEPIKEKQQARARVSFDMKSGKLQNAESFIVDLQAKFPGVDVPAQVARFEMFHAESDRPPRHRKLALALHDWMQREATRSTTTTAGTQPKTRAPGKPPTGDAAAIREGNRDFMADLFRRHASAGDVIEGHAQEVPA